MAEPHHVHKWEHHMHQTSLSQPVHHAEQYVVPVKPGNTWLIGAIVLAGMTAIAVIAILIGVR